MCKVQYRHSIKNYVFRKLHSKFFDYEKSKTSLSEDPKIYCFTFFSTTYDVINLYKVLLSDVSLLFWYFSFISTLSLSQSNPLATYVSPSFLFLKLLLILLLHWNYLLCFFISSELAFSAFFNLSALFIFPDLSNIPPGTIFRALHKAKQKVAPILKDAPVLFVLLQPFWVKIFSLNCFAFKTEVWENFVINS